MYRQPVRGVTAAILTLAICTSLTTSAQAGTSDGPDVCNPNEGCQTLQFNDWTEGNWRNVGGLQVKVTRHRGKRPGLQTIETAFCNFSPYGLRVSANVHSVRSYGDWRSMTLDRSRGILVCKVCTHQVHRDAGEIELYLRTSLK